MDHSFQCKLRSLLASFYFSLVAEKEVRLKNNVRLKILMDQGFSPNSSHPPLLELDSMFCDDLEMGWGGREAQRREDICIYIADSCFCTRETNTAW